VAVGAPVGDLLTGVAVVGLELGQDVGAEVGDKVVGDPDVGEEVVGLDVGAVVV
jgi:hypothetical protein